MSALRLEGVRKSFGEHEVLRGIDLELDDHEVVCLIGASGSGKSTLLRCINLLEPLDGGRIFLGGEELTRRGVDANDVRRRIGIVFQAFNLFPHMTVLRNVTLAPRDVLKLPRAEAEARALELLARFGLESRRDEYPDRLSGGQQQRVAIVRALAMRPELMLLDEVTSALDPELVAEVLSVIRELAEGGMTMLIATHEMGFARDIASRVCFLDDGQILEQGSPQEIFADPKEPRTQQFLERIIEAGPSYPVQFDVEYPERELNRLTTGFRIFMVIPIAIVLASLGGESQAYAGRHWQGGVTFGGLLTLAPLLMILFRQKYPRWWFDWNLELLRFQNRVGAYLALLDDQYPSTDDHQSVRLQMSYPDAERDLNRWLPLVKWLLAIPHFIVLVFLWLAALFVVVFAWFAILFTGRYPRGLFEFVVGVGRWTNRVTAYALVLVTDEYPPFRLSP
jgi:polar amino acid transport system ATP-binding protein